MEKCGDYSFQRRSYSVHKGRPLAKPMMLVATDSYILTVLGPNLADGKKSDVKITEHMLRSNSGISEIDSVKKFFVLIEGSEMYRDY